MVSKLRKFVRGLVKGEQLDAELAKLVLNVIGDGRLIEAKRIGQEITVGLNLQTLLALIPRTGNVTVKLSTGTTVDGLTAGGGKYAGTFWIRATGPISVTTDLAEADIGTAGSNCLVVNVQEVGKSTHDLAGSGFLPLIFIGVLLGSTAGGTPVVLINGDQWEDC